MTPNDPAPEHVPDQVPDQVPAAAPAASEAAPAGLTPAACAEKLKELFPALFAGGAKPIKLRIQADIQARAPGVFTKPVLSAFLRRYTGATSYLIALTRAPQRLDLDGQPAGEISEEHRQAAAEELKRRRAVHDERRALEDQQRHNRAQLLRDFERTTLTRANFCALKGVADDELDGLLEIARREAAEAPPPARPDRGPRADRADRQERRGPPPHRPARDARPERGEGRGAPDGRPGGPRQPRR